MKRGAIMKKRKNEGSAILLVLVILVSIAILGASSLNTSTYENKMVWNFKIHEIQFNLADGAINTVLPMIRDTVKNTEVPVELVAKGVLTSAEAESLFDQLGGYADYDATPDFSMTFGPEAGDDVAMDTHVDVNVDIERLGSIAMKGSALKFAHGGSGFNPGSAIVYRIDSVATGGQSTQSNVEGIYYKVLGP